MSAARSIRADLPPVRVAFFAHDFAVLDPIEPGYGVRAPAAAVLATRAVEAVSDDPADADLQAHVIVADSDRIDLDVMEHERQRRLRSWQRLPVETK